MHLKNKTFNSVKYPQVPVFIMLSMAKHVELLFLFLGQVTAFSFHVLSNFHLRNLLFCSPKRRGANHPVAESEQQVSQVPKIVSDRMRGPSYRHAPAERYLGSTQHEQGEETPSWHRGRMWKQLPSIRAHSHRRFCEKTTMGWMVRYSAEQGARPVSLHSEL